MLKLTSGLNDGIDDCESIRSQVGPVQRSVRDFYALEKFMQGKGATAIREYFQEVHTPFLVTLQQSLIDYQKTLEDLRDALYDYESNGSGYIRQDFLEEDLPEGFNKVGEVAAEKTSEANKVLDDVADIVSVEKIDDSEVMECIEDGKKEAEKVYDELKILDDYETNQLEKTKEDLAKMKAYLSDIKSGLKKGDISIENFDINSIEDMDSYQTIHDGIYNRDAEEEEELTEESIEEMPITAIEENNKEAKKGLDADQSALMDDAIGKLKNEDIDRQEYLEYVKEIEKYEETDEISDVIVDHLSNVRGNVSGFTTDFILEAANQTGNNPAKSAEIINQFIGTNNPEKTLDFLNKHGNKLNKGSAVIQKVLIPIDGGIGMYQDMIINDKEPGEAVSHNLLKVGSGSLPGVIFVGVTGSNPTGWTALGLFTLGAGATKGYDYLYDNNIGGTETAVDAVGNFFQGAFETIGDAHDYIDDSVVGDAIRQNAEDMNRLFYGTE